MQSLAWYRRRLRSMSPQEVWWRLGVQVRESLDRCIAPLRRKHVDLQRITHCNGKVLAVKPEVIGRHLVGPEGLEFSTPVKQHGWCAALIQRADRICQNRLSIFDLEDHDLGPEIDWNYEYKAKKKTPMCFASAIDYRDYAVTGDCKFVWEPNRHQHWVVLGRAYRQTGEHRYAAAVAEQLDSWIRQCPYGMGMNWRSPLELGIRLINWVWALELIRPCGLLTPDRNHRLHGVVYRHLSDISRKYSRFSSANNHLIGEAAGVFIASNYFISLKDAPTWKRQSREILIREIEAQTYPDGGNREQSMGYHLFVLELLLLAGLVARNVGEDFPTGYWELMERMFEFLGAFTEGGGEIPMFGDCDDGYVLDLGHKRSSARELLAVGAAIFGRSDYKAWSGGFSEPAFWLLGREGVNRYEQIDTANVSKTITSQAFADTGYYLLQCGRRKGDDRISVTFDCGDLGFGSIAAHGHADALSFTLRIAGRDVFVDPGTYDYFTYGSWRDYFRSTRAHNTVVVDGRDQSAMLGPFLWGRPARAKCLYWEPTADGGTVVGEHDGYALGTQPVIHRRTIKLNGKQGEIEIQDELVGPGRHTAVQYLHLAEQCSVERVGENSYVVNFVNIKIMLELDPLWHLTQRHDERPIFGWVSRGYHQKTPSITLVGQIEWENSATRLVRLAVKYRNNTS